MIKGYPQPEKGKYKVYVRTITYNQSEYIADTFNGVVMQQTDFPFAHVVYDDCSTDGEQDVIRKWLAENCQMDNAVWYDNEPAEIVEVKHNTNPNLTVVVYFFKRNLHKEKELKAAHFTPWREVCDYEALCEGDDYWIDSYKLKEQVALLEENYNLGMCYTRYNIYHQKERKLVQSDMKMGLTRSIELIYHNCIGTLTTMVRCDLLKRYLDEIKPHTHNWKMGDWPIWLWFSENSQIGFIDKTMATYRVLSESAMHGGGFQRKLDFFQSELDIVSFFNDKYQITNAIDLSDYYNRLLFIYATHYDDKKASVYYQRIKNKKLSDKYRMVLIKLHISKASIKKILSRCGFKSNE